MKQGKINNARLQCRGCPAYVIDSPALCLTTDMADEDGDTTHPFGIADIPVPKKVRSAHPIVPDAAPHVLAEVRSMPQST